LKTAIIATIIGGVVVGMALLWVEYQYFIPFYDKDNTTEPTMSSTDHQHPCTPGQIFSDKLLEGGKGPEMVVIPDGKFRTGDIHRHSDGEHHLHHVSVSSIAIGRSEVTFAEYDRFAVATSREKPSDEGWGRGKRPVINVSWFDAIAYTEWLSQQTGKQYRLPKEAEWEYAARAGTETKYWWGNKIGFNQANCDGCGSQWDNKKTAPIGSFNSNYFNLYDTLGNVYEWTCSEYENEYNGKEQQCSDKQNTSSFRVIRGGSWYSLPAYVRAAARFGNRPKNQDITIGFRVVMEHKKNNLPKSSAQKTTL